ncbi:MAG TPA: 4Fe-4S binding protein, partial [Spirochaetota bacterium]|nr:4Fe-4S binding protein [Spirochaetota bacterium]
MMAVYLLSIAGVSVVTGLLFEKNTFCRYVCPVGHLLGLYSRLSIIGWRVKNKDICSTCKDKSCIRQDYLYNTATKSCGVDLYPGRLDDNTNCILCAGCLKACGTYNSTGVKERPNPGFSYIGFARDIFNHKALSYAEAAFLFVVSGFVISEILSEWNASNAVISMLPGIVKAAVGAKGALSTGLIDGFVVFLGYPFVIWTIPFIMLRLSGSGISAGEYLRNYAVAFIPIMAAAHLCKSILKMSSRIPYFQYAAADPTGMEMANDIVNKQIVLATMPEWTAYVVTALMVIFIAVGIHVSMRIIRNLNEAFIHAGKTARFAYSIPLLYGGIFAVTIVLWRFAG